LIHWKTLLLSVLVLLPCLAIAKEDPNKCYNPEWEVRETVHPTRGKVVLYVPPADYYLTSTNLACITAIQVLRHRNKMPPKMLVGLISKDLRQAFLAQWSFKRNRFTIFEAKIPIGTSEALGTFISFPEPLYRLREIMTVRKFPTKEELPIHLQDKYKLNYVHTSREQLKRVLKSAGVIDDAALY
jgi:hypothetical protein